MLTEILVAFAATIGFAIIFNVSPRYLVVGGLSGAIGWLIYLLMGYSNFGIFVAAVGIGLMAEIGARVLHIPVLLIAVPGIIPLVPGVQAYRTMLSLVRGDYLGALTNGTETLFVAGAIAVGIAVATVPLRLGRRGGVKSVRKTARSYFTSTDPDRV